MYLAILLDLAMKDKISKLLFVQPEMLRKLKD